MVCAFDRRVCILSAACLSVFKWVQFKQPRIIKERFGTIPAEFEHQLLLPPSCNMEIPAFAPATEEQKTFEIMVEPDTDQLVPQICEQLLRCGRMHINKGTLKMSNVTIVFDGRVFYFIATCNNISQVDHAIENCKQL